MSQSVEGAQIWQIMPRIKFVLTACKCHVSFHCLLKPCRLIHLVCADSPRETLLFWSISICLVWFFLNVVENTHFFVVSQVSQYLFGNVHCFDALSWWRLKQHNGVSFDVLGMVTDGKVCSALFPSTSYTEFFKVFKNVDSKENNQRHTLIPITHIINLCTEYTTRWWLLLTCDPFHEQL